MSLPSFLVGDRQGLEDTARRATQVLPLADGELMCRVLSRYLMFVDPRDLGVTPRLCLDGFWESWITAAVARVLRPGLFCVDVGANHGYYTLLLADGAGPDGRVLAIEPNPALARLLALSVEVNGFSGRTVVAAQAATDGCATEVSLAIPRRRAACASICRPAGGDDEVVPVPAASIDGLTHGWPRVDLVKIDAEGAEDRIWRGMSRTIRDNPRLIVLIEFVPSRYGDAPAFLDAIESAGFPLRVIAHDSTVEPIAAAEALTDGSGEGWTLFLQREWD